MKKPKKKTKYLVMNREFDNFKSFKTFAWLTMSPGEVTIGTEYFRDTIYKEYKIKRTERRLIVEKIYSNLHQQSRKNHRKRNTEHEYL